MRQLGDCVGVLYQYIFIVSLTAAGGWVVLDPYAGPCLFDNGDREDEIEIIL